MFSQNNSWRIFLLMQTNFPLRNSLSMLVICYDVRSKGTTSVKLVNIIICVQHRKLKPTSARLKYPLKKGICDQPYGSHHSVRPANYLSKILLWTSIRNSSSTTLSTLGISITLFGLTFVLSSVFWLQLYSISFVPSHTTT